MIVKWCESTFFLFNYNILVYVPRGGELRLL